MDSEFIFSSGKLELKTEGKDFFVEGYISTSDKDLVNDIVTKNCLMDMAEQMRTRTIKLDIEHEAFRGKSEMEMQINKTLIPAAKIDDFVVDKKGLKVRAMLNRHISRFQEIKNSIQDGFIDAFSIAFVPVKDTIEEKNGEQVRMLEKINLLNVAFTGNPINTNAGIEKVFMKSLDYLEEKDKEYEVKSTYCKECGEEKRVYKEIKDNIHVSDTKIKLQEVKNMTEENKKNQEVGVKDEVEEAKEEVAEAKEPVAEAVEEKPAEPVEAPVENAEVKDLQNEVKDLKKELTEIKSLIAKPIMKSKVEQVDKADNFEDKSISPLDLI